jgi:hypothetical protein
MLPFVILATLRTCEPPDWIQLHGRSGSKTSLAEAPNDDQNGAKITMAQAAQPPVLAVHTRESSDGSLHDERGQIKERARRTYSSWLSFQATSPSTLSTGSKSRANLNNIHRLTALTAA